MLSPAKDLRGGKDSDYRDRNGRILDFSEELIGFPLREAALEKLSRTWMTIRMTEKQGIPVRMVVLED